MVVGLLLEVVTTKKIVGKKLVGWGCKKKTSVTWHQLPQLPPPHSPTVGLPCLLPSDDSGIGSRRYSWRCCRRGIYIYMVYDSLCINYRYECNICMVYDCICIYICNMYIYTYVYYANISLGYCTYCKTVHDIDRNIETLQVPALHQWHQDLQGSGTIGNEFICHQTENGKSSNVP